MANMQNLGRHLYLTILLCFTRAFHFLLVLEGNTMFHGTYGTTQQQVGSQNFRNMIKMQKHVSKSYFLCYP